MRKHIFINIFHAIFFPCSPPYPWLVAPKDTLNADSEFLLNITTYAGVYLSYIILVIRFICNGYKKYISSNISVPATIALFLLSIAVAYITWAIIIHTVYVSTCSYYPWIIALAMGALYKCVCFSRFPFREDARTRQDVRSVGNDPLDPYFCKTLVPQRNVSIQTPRQASSNGNVHHRTIEPFRSRGSTNDLEQDPSLGIPFDTPSYEYEDFEDTIFEDQLLRTHILQPWNDDIQSERSLEDDIWIMDHSLSSTPRGSSNAPLEALTNDQSRKQLSTTRGKNNELSTFRTSTPKKTTGISRLKLDKVPQATRQRRSVGNKGSRSESPDVKTVSRKGYCGNCWRTTATRHSPRISHLRQFRTTRSGLVYGPPNHTSTMEEYVEEYGL